MGLGLARTLKKYHYFIKMSSDFNFTGTSWFLGNVQIKPYSKHSRGEGGSEMADYCISANSFCWNYSSEETIRGNTVYDNFTPIVLDISEVCCFKTRKNQGLSLTWISSQLSIWAHKCHSRLNHGAKIKIARCLKSLL